MRTTTLCVMLLGTLAACHSTIRPVEPLRAATDQRLAQTIVEASLRREPGPAPAQVLALDPVVAQLLRASFVAYEHQRRVAIENLTNVDTSTRTASSSRARATGCCPRSRCRATRSRSRSIPRDA